MAKDHVLRSWVCVLLLVLALTYWAFLPRGKSPAIGECNFEAEKVAITSGAQHPDLSVFAACMAAKGYRSNTEGFLKIAQGEGSGDWAAKSYEAYLNPSSWTIIWPWEVRRPATYVLVP